MIKAPIELRLSRHYDDAWRDLDRSRTLCVALVTPARPIRVRYAGEARDHRVYVQHAKVPRGINGAQAAQALANTTQRACRHEHDCCGCWHRSVSVKRRGKRTFVVITRAWRNV